MNVYITKDKAYKRAGMKEEYKAFIKSFKEQFTEGDLVALYVEAFGDAEDELAYMDILMADVEVFGQYKVAADITVWLKRWSKVVQLNYYIDDDMGVDKGENLHSETVFKRV